MLINDTIIPDDKAFLHVAGVWHPSAHHEEYVTPSRYAEIMQDSVFVLCPKVGATDPLKLVHKHKMKMVPLTSDLDHFTDDLHLAIIGLICRWVPPHCHTRGTASNSFASMKRSKLERFQYLRKRQLR